MNVDGTIDVRFRRAIADGETAEVAELLASGADPNSQPPEGDWSPLMVAIEMSHADTVEILLSAGARVNYTTPDGWTALHHAVDIECDGFVQAGRQRTLQVLQLLLDAGADPGATTVAHCGSALDLAMRYGWPDGEVVLRASRRK